MKSDCDNWTVSGWNAQSWNIRRLLWQQRHANVISSCGNNWQLPGRLPLRAAPPLCPDWSWLLQPHRRHWHIKRRRQQRLLRPSMMYIITIIIEVAVLNISSHQRPIRIEEQIYLRCTIIGPRLRRQQLQPPATTTHRIIPTFLTTIPQVMRLPLQPNHCTRLLPQHRQQLPPST